VHYQLNMLFRDHQPSRIQVTKKFANPFASCGSCIRARLLWRCRACFCSRPSRTAFGPRCPATYIFPGSYARKIFNAPWAHGLLLFNMGMLRHGRMGRIPTQSKKSLWLCTPLKPTVGQYLLKKLLSPSGSETVNSGEVLQGKGSVPDDRQ